MGSGLYRLWLFGTDLRRMDEGDHERTVPRPLLQWRPSTFSFSRALLVCLMCRICQLGTKRGMMMRHASI